MALSILFSQTKSKELEQHLLIPLMKVEWQERYFSFSSQHNNANILVIDVTILGTEFLESVIYPFATEEFEKWEEKHVKRVAKLHTNEKWVKWQKLAINDENGF